MHDDEVTSFDPNSCWEYVGDFVKRHAQMPDGSPISPEMAKVVAFGAWIGCRLALTSRAFALGLAYHGNQREERPFVSVREGMAREYQEMVERLVNSTLFAQGFSDMLGKYVDDKRTQQADKPPPITQADADNIVGSIEDFFRRKDEGDA